MDMRKKDILENISKENKGILKTRDASICSCWTGKQSNNE